jgi:hypothetical protein
VIRFSELVAALSPTQFAQISLLLFLGVFVAIAVRHSGRRRVAEYDACAQMPLANDDAPRAQGGQS